MDWEAIGAVGEILGAIAVIASLFYVAYQVKQNTQQNKLNTISMESANSEAINIAHNDARLRLAENPELLRAYLKVQKDPESLSEEETMMSRLFMAAGISNGQLSFESEQRGVSSQWQGMQNVANAWRTLVLEGIQARLSNRFSGGNRSPCKRAVKIVPAGNIASQGSNATSWLDALTRVAA